MAAAFESLGVMPEIVRALEQDLGWDLPRDIQEEAIPLILGGGDVMAAAETGSGKTGAFALPLVQVVYETLREIASGGGRPASTGSQIRLSAEDREDILVLDAEGTAAQSRHEKQWGGGRATVGVIKGKYYYEAYCKDEGLSRMGWSLASGTYNLGTDNKGYGFGGTGKKSFEKNFDTYGVPFGKGDTLGCFIDCDSGTIHWSVNGTEFPVAFQIKQKGSAWYPAVVLKNAEVEFNFGLKPFKYPPSMGYISIASAKPENTSLKAIGTLDQGRQPLALILEPTRELAEQTHMAVDSFLKYLPPPQVRAVLMVGGDASNTQMKDMRLGADILTGTIGRIESLISMGQLSLKNIRFFVLDEADQMLEQDSFKSILSMYKSIPKTGKPFQVLMFSATLHSPEIKKLSEQICKFPQLVDLKGKPTIPDNVDHAIYIVDPLKEAWASIKNKTPTDGIHANDEVRGTSKAALSEGIKVLKAELLRRIIEKFKMDQALIFVRTKVDADNLHRYFQSHDRGMLGSYTSAVLYGGKATKERRSNLDDFKKGEIRFLIATDVAARGIDIESLPYVINYTLPPKPELYIHRIGRTGRSEKIGLAISLVGAHEEKVWYHTCPSKGTNCHNTRLVEEQGCAIWYNEPELVKSLESLLGQPIPHLGPDLSLPISVGKGYGGKKGGDEELEKHQLQLKPVVEQLSILEDEAQKSFLKLQMLFHKKK